MSRATHIALIACSAVLMTACDSDVPSSSAAPQAQTSAAVAPPVHVNLDLSGMALGGHDPVAYHQQEQAVRGKSEYTARWDDATWLFASAENRDAFSANPEQFAPANGGFCTFGVVLNKKFDGNPKVWAIEAGRLHVFLNEEVKRKFYLDKTGNLEKVERNWPQIKNKSPLMLGS